MNCYRLSVLSIELVGCKTWMEKCGKKKMWIAKKKLKRMKREMPLAKREDNDRVTRVS